MQTADFSAELGRAAGAVLNATIKSGTNSLHGAVWEFFRNDVLDAADWFENNTRHSKGRTSPESIRRLHWRPDHQEQALLSSAIMKGLRRVQGTVSNGNVPTLTSATAAYTNLVGYHLRARWAPRTDALGRPCRYGTVLDPATTRSVAAGAVDPVPAARRHTSRVLFAIRSAPAPRHRDYYARGCRSEPASSLAASIRTPSSC